MLRDITTSQAIVAAGMAMICIIAMISCVQDQAQGATVRCVLDKSVLCQQRKACTKCKQCKTLPPGQDCCCVHTPDDCKSEISGVKCCEAQ